LRMNSKINNLIRAIRKYAFWLATIFMGMVLVVFEEYEPFFSIGIFLYIALFAIWVINRLIVLSKLKNEKSKSEILHLQSQVNPHFFFNTLNNLYGLVEKDSKKAQQLILKLSDLMRYSIYEGQKDKVTLEEEVDYLKNYVDLQKMRYHKQVDVTFNLHIQEEGCQVMPLLFIILLENAFKHGVEKLREDAYVHISLISSEEDIKFAIENNFDSNELPEEAGIGLKNLKRRLELVYPGKHTLSSSSANEVHKAQLSLILK